MAPLRPANLNKRLVSSQGGNLGIVGPNAINSETGSFFCTNWTLGCRIQNNVGCRGVIKLNESYNSSICGCRGTIDCKGFYICCGPGSTKWFVAPSCTQIGRDYYSGIVDVLTVANSCMGSCGWFAPLTSQLCNPGYVCRVYWDTYSPTRYWGSDPQNQVNKTGWNFGTGEGFGGNGNNGAHAACFRAFRCTA